MVDFAGNIYFLVSDCSIKCPDCSLDWRASLKLNIKQTGQSDW